MYLLAVRLLRLPIAIGSNLNGRFEVDLMLG